MQLFVYYKFLEQEQADVKQRVQTMQTKLQQRFPQLLVQLMKRPKTDELRSYPPPKKQQPKNAFDCIGAKEHETTSSTLSAELGRRR